MAPHANTIEYVLRHRQNIKKIGYQLSKHITNTGCQRLAWPHDGANRNRTTFNKSSSRKCYRAWTNSRNDIHVDSEDERLNEGAIVVTAQ